MEVETSRRLALGDDEDVGVFDVGDVLHPVEELHLEEARTVLEVLDRRGVCQRTLGGQLVSVETRLEDVSHHLRTYNSTKNEIRIRDRLHRRRRNIYIQR